MTFKAPTTQSGTNRGSISLDVQHSNSHNIAHAFEGMIQKLQERLRELSASNSNHSNSNNSTNKRQSEHQHENQAKLNLHFNIPGRNRENSESTTASADE